jgi:8-amino-7-oxononanoate synthase
MVSGRVVFAGDAAHPMLPNLGQGGGQAIEDGVTLGRVVADAGGDLDAALARYDALRARHTRKVVALSARLARVGHLRNPALAALRIIRSDEGPQLFERVLTNARYLRDGLHDLGFQVVEKQALPDGSDAVTTIVPVVVGDDWKAVLLWRALYDAGVYVNVALHPAVPPAGALLRTSVMATHTTEQLDRVLDAFQRVGRQLGIVGASA